VFERHLNHDLGAVRIHTGETASARAASVSARALTLGTDVMFGAGQYRPDTLAGRRLLAHELVHAARHSTARPARTVLRSPLVSVEEIGPVPGPEAEPRGQAVGRYARVGEVTPHLTLRSAMDPRSIGLLPDPLYVDALHLNDRVFVLEEFRDDWVKVRTDDGQLGYVSKVYLFIGAPDPDARLYRIREGDTALGIAQQFYDCGEWGTDGRFYVNVLVAVNEASEGRGSGKKGIYKAGNRSEKDVASWKDTRLLADYWIWVPGKAFARSLAGTVSSGSVTYELWQSVKGVVGLVVGILDGIATTLVSLVTDIVDLISMIVDTVVDIAKKGLVAKLRELRAFVEGLDPAQIASALWSGFTTRWNAEDSYDRWKFRGVVIGTVLAEIALAALSGGASVALRVAGKVGKVAKLAAKLGKLDSVADFARKVDRAADATDAGRRVRKALKGRDAPEPGRTPSGGSGPRDLTAKERADIDRRNAESGKRATTGDAELDAEIDSAIEGATRPDVTGGIRPRIADRPVTTKRRPRLDLEDIPRRPGESARDALARVRQVIGRRISDTPLGPAWETARAAVLKGRTVDQIGRAGVIKRYKQAQRTFWREVRKDPDARAFLEDAGFEFGKAPAPVLKVTRTDLPVEEVRVSLDHALEKAVGVNWRKALDADNLDLEFHNPNSFREALQVRHKMRE
jgi:hypothetical protein